MDYRKYINFTIPQAVKLEAQKGLDARKRDKRGVAQPAVSAGDYILRKSDISPGAVRKFSEAFKSLTPDASPAHYTMFKLYGGEAGRDWIAGLEASMERVSESVKAKDSNADTSIDREIDSDAAELAAASNKFNLDSLVPTTVKSANMWIEIAENYIKENKDADPNTSSVKAEILGEYRARGGEFLDTSRKWVDLSRKTVEGNFESVFFPDTLSDDEIRMKYPTCVRYEIARGLSNAEIEAFTKVKSRGRSQFSTRPATVPAITPAQTSEPRNSNVTTVKGEQKVNKGQIFAFQGDAIKDLGAGKVGGYLVRFSDSTSPDLEGDYFTKNTDFGLEMGTKCAILYAHGFSSTLKTKRIGIGDLATDDNGIYIKGQLNLSTPAEQTIYQAVQRGELGWSSGTAAHLVETRQVGGAREIMRWPLGIDASLTPNPAEPRNKALTIKSISEVDFNDPLEYAFKNADRDAKVHQETINQLLEIAVSLQPTNLKQFNLANAAMEVPDGFVDESVVSQYQAETRVLRTEILGYQEQLKSLEAVQADYLAVKQENEALRERIQMLLEMQDMDAGSPATGADINA